MDVIPCNILLTPFIKLSNDKTNEYFFCKKSKEHQLSLIRPESSATESLPHLQSAFFSILLEYYCFTMLCQFLLHGKVNQLYVYICPVFFGFPSYLYNTEHWVPCAISRFSFVTYFMHSVVYMLIPISHSSHPSFPPSVHTFVLYVCISISALQTSSSIPFFQITHMYANTQYLFFSFWLTSLCMTVPKSTHISTNGTISFLWLSTIPLNICAISSLSDFHFAHLWNNQWWYLLRRGVLRIEEANICKGAL